MTFIDRLSIMIAYYEAHVMYTKAMLADINNFKSGAEFYAKENGYDDLREAMAMYNFGEELYNDLKNKITIEEAKSIVDNNTFKD